MDATHTGLPGLGGNVSRVGQRAGRRLLRADILTVAFEGLAVWDVLAVAVSGYACAEAYVALSASGTGSTFATSFDGLELVAVGAVLAPAVLRSRQVRSAFEGLAIPPLLSLTFQRLTLWLALVLGVVVLTGRGHVLPRLWLTAWMTLALLLVAGARPLLVHALRRAAARGWLRDRVAVVGTGPAVPMLAARMRDASATGVDLVRVFDLRRGGPAGFAAVLAELTALGRRSELDRVVVALPDRAAAQAIAIARQLRALDVEVSHCPFLLGLLDGAVHTTEVGGSPLIVLARRPFAGGGLLMKSLFDRLAAFAVLLLLWPLLALAALAVRLDSPGPVIFRQSRHGWNGTEFAVLKFRTMRWDGAAGGDGAVQTRRGDGRVTRVGALLRKTSLDELPQLFNVLNGTMSLVGPRPHPVVMRTEDRLGDEIIAEYSHRHRVKPGITGWAQIHGLRGATATAADVRRRVEHDLYYIDNWSFLLDLRILVLTPLSIAFRRRNAF